MNVKVSTISSRSKSVRSCDEIKGDGDATDESRFAFDRGKPYLAYERPDGRGDEFRRGIYTMGMWTTKAAILLADDEDDLRKTLGSELENVGYDVTTARDGEEAISAVRSKKFDLALLDIKMPKADGIEVLRIIKEEVPSTKVLMLTAYADLRHAMESKKNGADDFMSKPYDIEDLLLTVERLLGK